jgi:hypothetical protein
MVETVTNPPELSADGKRNAYYHNCKVIGGDQNFAVCLNKVEKRKAGALPAIYADCSAAIGKKACPAIAMRKQELQEGKAIFFLERQRDIKDTPMMGKARNLFKPTRTEPKQSAPVSKPAPSSGNYMADALNQAFKDQHSKI